MSLFPCHPLCPSTLVRPGGLPQCRHLWCSPLCPGRLLRPRSCQSFAMHGVPPICPVTRVLQFDGFPAQVGCCPLEVAKVSPCIVSLPLCPGRLLCPRSSQSVVIYRVVHRVPPFAQVGCCALEVTKVLPLIVFPSLPR